MNKFSIVEGNFAISSPFGERIHPISKIKKMHNGVDIAGIPIGTPVISPVDGIVHIANFSASAGNWIHIFSEDMMFIFMHLNKIDVKVCEHVKKYQKIAEVGNTGASTGAHLHFEVRKNNIPIDPIQYLTF
jgi:murein DD-endopeptidase MepM/ murein hydrolase activator NlpD